MVINVENASDLSEVTKIKVNNLKNVEYHLTGLTESFENQKENIFN